MEDPEEDLTVLGEDWVESGVMEKEADNKSEEKQRTDFDDSQFQWELEEEKGRKHEEDRQKEVSNCQVEKENGNRKKTWNGTNVDNW